MIYGIGCDLVKISRLQKSLDSSSFWERVFGAEERAALSKLSDARRVESAAANFAAKEAFLKAAGTGLSGFALGEIQALRAESGAPFYRFSGKAADFMAAQGLAAHLSLSHEDGLAQAAAILEKIELPKPQDD